MEGGREGGGEAGMKGGRESGKTSGSRSRENYMYIHSLYGMQTHVYISLGYKHFTVYMPS